MFIPRVPGDPSGPEVPVLTPSASETYLEAFRELSREHPECWYLCCRAEDRCRAEHVPRVGRLLAQELGRQPSWSEVFIAAAQDDRYWDKEVRRPALGFLARGNANKRPGADAVPDVPDTHPAERPPKKQRAQHPAGGGAGGHQGQGGGKSKRTKKRGANTGGHPRRSSDGKYQTSREGDELCYKFSKGGAEACPSPCPNGRAHLCQLCLQPHRTGSEACSVRRT